MSGNSIVTGDQAIFSTDNLSFDGTRRTGAMTTDGQLWIGATASNRSNNGGHVRLGNIISSDASINVVNGAGSIDIRGQAAGFQPNVAVQEFDDFIGSGGSNVGAWKMPWRAITGSGLFGVTGTINNPGIATSVASGAGQPNGMNLFQAGAVTTFPSQIALGGGLTSISWIVQLSSLSSGGNTYRFSCGMADNVTLQTATDSFVSGVYFQYTNAVNGGQWTINCTSASVTTSVNTSVVANTSFVTLTIIANAAASSVSFYINNILVGTAISTNIPTAALSPFMMAVNLSGTNPNLNADLFWITISLSNPRPGPTSAVAPFSGRQILSYTATPISYQVLGTDAIIGVTSTASARTITMPNTNLVTGQVWTIKDESLAAATNNITISGNGTNILASTSASTYVINTNGGSVDIYYNGLNFVIK